MFSESLLSIHISLLSYLGFLIGKIRGGVLRRVLFTRAYTWDLWWKSSEPSADWSVDEINQNILYRYGVTSGQMVLVLTESRPLYGAEVLIDKYSQYNSG